MPPIEPSTWVVYAVNFSMVIALVLFVSALRDILVVLRDWCGFGDTKTYEEEYEGDSVTVSQETAGITQTENAFNMHANKSPISPEERIPMLERQVAELQRRLFELERNANIPACAAAGTGVGPAMPAGFAPPPPPPPPPIVQSSKDPVPLKQSNGKPKGTHEEAAAAPSMQDVLRELFQSQRKVVQLVSSPRKNYLHKRLGGMKPVNSPLRKSTTAQWLTEKPTGRLDAPSQSKALQSLKAIASQVATAYEVKDSGIIAERENAAVHLEMDRAGVTTPPLIANSAESHCLVNDSCNVDDPLEGFTQVDDNSSDDSPRPDGVSRQGLSEQKMGSNKENSLPSKLAAPQKHPFMEGDLAKDIALVRLRKTNIPRSPGGTTLIPQRRTPPRPITSSTEHAFISLKEKFNQAYPRRDEDEGRTVSHVDDGQVEDPFA
ncbi:uncharacterized protein SPPG_02259 [Spizellomyces punctatus DAOM BR117]|uniref:Uncharacterized protein n=1 Tax=Spizellomyces punctatus (strain DAOM BR117) TaxID=645134 RepID=A0A0L0HQ27_SPIPD|nr:uncharacterized protein SPPG_02259 [Spizellomyces punctatus DAOM BR117]KND03202.1 hypothetical protein SPPG_02259 [Spizellomyces punctatus DAOM BR117]|eukprot:XP_016611241.1 hypothetical protein SPPG_02259 [Spizellomyces punctatus DAOM BR117]